MFGGVRLGERLALNHLQFADDTLLFCENDGGQLELLCHTLFAFMFASGLKLNLGKSLLIGCNMDDLSVEEEARKYGWTVGKLPITYLGATLGGNPKRLCFWEPMLDKLRKKGRSYNSKYMSLSGRLVLLKAALNSIPIFWFAIFKAPAGVIREIEKVYRSFLWGNEERGRKVAWIPWESVCTAKERGGLDLGFIGWKNKALLIKWAWNFGTAKNSLWRKVIIAKYKMKDEEMLLHRAMEEGGNGLL